MTAPEQSSLIPVTLLTGFLGSGKTTVLNHVLKQPGMAATAVIVNEFGEIGLDHLLVERSSEDVVLLNSGCLCCTVRGDIVDTLTNLFVDRVKGKVPYFTRIAIETTGLADPAPILHTLMTDPIVAARYMLDGVVTTVDAVNGLRQIDEHAEAVKQAALADRLLLTKTDLAAAEAIHALKERLADLNPGAARHTVANGEIAPDALFGAALFDPSRKSVDINRWINERAYQARGHDHGGHHDGEHGHGEHEHGGHRHGEHGHGEHGHDSDIRACCLTSDEPLSWDAVSSWLSRLRKGAGNDLLRVKGILNLIGESAPVAIHGVHHVFHPPVQLDAWPDADRRSRIVFITRGIDHADLEASFLEHVAGARV